jgi:hypothetical protein
VGDGGGVGLGPKQPAIEAAASTTTITPATSSAHDFSNRPTTQPPHRLTTALAFVYLRHRSESILAGHPDKTAFTKIFFLPGVIDPLEFNKGLQILFADGRDEFSAGT